MTMAHRISSEYTQLAFHRAYRIFVIDMSMHFCPIAQLVLANIFKLWFPRSVHRLRVSVILLRCIDWLQRRQRQ